MTTDTAVERELICPECDYQRIVTDLPKVQGKRRYYYCPNCTTVGHDGGRLILTRIVPLQDRLWGTT